MTSFLSKTHQTPTFANTCHIGAVLDACCFNVGQIRFLLVGSRICFLQNCDSLEKPRVDPSFFLSAKIITLSKTHKSPEKRGHLENRKRIILKKPQIFQGAVTFCIVLGGCKPLYLGRPYRFSQVSMSFFRSLGRLQCWTTFHLPTFQHGLNDSLCQLL